MLHAKKERQKTKEAENLKGIHRLVKIVDKTENHLKSVFPETTIHANSTHSEKNGIPDGILIRSEKEKALEN
ncbi:hypothetical protein KDM87_06765 [Undibacterium sp. FT147W]|uniref:Uncharacterized protein n=1 Tax=Undibacterium rivi TaxID=2828729 RepID=A0ABS5H0Q9_9BURK|nr:hypothetical protein [Undibacterium rivi]MBR7792297.1 hypothetical protein [Undibacterium rivi]